MQGVALFGRTDREINRAVTPDFVQARTLHGIEPLTLCHQVRAVAARREDRAGGRTRLAGETWRTSHQWPNMPHGLKRGKIRGRLITASEGRHIALQQAVQFQPVVGGGHEIPRPAILLRIDQSAIEIGGEKYGAGKFLAHRLQDQQGIVGIAAENSDCSDRILVIPLIIGGDRDFRHLPLDPVCQPLRVIELACPDRPLMSLAVEQHVLHRFRAVLFGAAALLSSGGFPIEPTEITVAPDV